jgi:hypothetical protein
MSIDAVDLLESDGVTLVAHLPATVIDAPADRRNDVTRMLTFEVRMEYLQALKVLGRMIKAYDGTTLVFVGYPDTPSIHRAAREATVSVPCRDKAAKPKDALFSTDTVYESTPTDTTVAFTATASSQMQTSSSIQTYGQVIGTKLERLNVETTVEEVCEITFYEFTDSGAGFVVDRVIRTTHPELYENITSSGGATFSYGTYRTSRTASDLVAAGLVLTNGNPLTGTLTVTYTGTDAASTFRLTVDVDMRSTEAVAAITPTTNGTVEGTQISTDGVTWAAFTAGATGRYLRLVITSPTTPVTLSLAVVTTTDYQPSNVATDDGDSWRPLVTDFAKVVTCMFAAPTQVNTLFVRSGLADVDTSTRLVYAIDGTADGSTWTELITEASSTPNRLTEHLFTQATLRGIRLRILSCNGPIAIRYVRAANIVSTQYIPDIIQVTLAGCGETQFNFMQSHQYVTRLIAERGESKLTFCKKLAALMGAELFWTREGVCTLRPAEDYDITASTIPVDVAILSLDAEWTADVKNEIVGVCDLPDTQLSYTAQDADAGSPTCVQRIGHRTKVVMFPEADTAGKLENATKQELLKSLRRGSTVEYRVTAEPDMEVGRVRYVLDPVSGIGGFYTIDAYRLEWNPEASTYDMVCQGREV